MFNKSALAAAAATLMATPALAQDAMGIDEKVNQVFADVTGPFVGLIFAPFPGTSFPWIVMWLVIAASVFTLYFGLVQFRFFGHAIRLVKGRLLGSERRGRGQPLPGAGNRAVGDCWSW